ncbi:hypothetical protein CYLTODRAFT_490917 [Cylindrobasidium torrendii FP15055 ss-10]|uniref:Uncharacterized protein n=1 Tax=Cylindrobasidium torrendii FP15055 ss-10 TaxID=1314674 RepID=A0A0D7BA81_9AGAR|nr:hypothetical protein CYLTODRAFT_490917 [Cylindrobasidium torrendii FP15055 ss-10]
MSRKAIWCGYAMSISNLKTLVESVRDIDCDGQWQVQFQMWRASTTKENYYRIPPARTYKVEDDKVTEVFFSTRWIDKSAAGEDYTLEREEDRSQLADLVSFLQLNKVAIEKEWFKWVSKEDRHPDDDRYEWTYHILAPPIQRSRTRILADPAYTHRHTATSG